MAKQINTGIKLETPKRKDLAFMQRPSLQRLRVLRTTRSET